MLRRRACIAWALITAFDVPGLLEPVGIGRIALEERRGPMS